jgi:hypothetical protein
MTQPPVTVTYSLEEILSRIERKIDKIDERLTHLEIGQAKLTEKVDGLAKRLENQEFISRGVLIALIIAILGGFAKLFGVVGSP